MSQCFPFASPSARSWAILESSAIGSEPFHPILPLKPGAFWLQPPYPSWTSSVSSPTYSTFCADSSQRQATIRPGLGTRTVIVFARTRLLLYACYAWPNSKPLESVPYQPRATSANSQQPASYSTVQYSLAS
ncbi:hypothetical protein NM208_g17164 [Fusarium decemcellulare]|uniref:Uncharacterized protein n=1 Tax=Fusarium decemcellulare TaxID=57161 RepID=A0ACC1RAP8_9HYPO|nr:hypothetical protein NM208_g17164 [Fusarium decemcellulare]